MFLDPMLQTTVLKIQTCRPASPFHPPTPSTLHFCVFCIAAETIPSQRSPSLPTHPFQNNAFYCFWMQAFSYAKESPSPALCLCMIERLWQTVQRDFLCFAGSVYRRDVSFVLVAPQRISYNQWKLNNQARFHSFQHFLVPWRDFVKAGSYPSSCLSASKTQQKVQEFLRGRQIPLFTQTDACNSVKLIKGCFIWKHQAIGPLAQ